MKYYLLIFLFSIFLARESLSLPLSSPKKDLSQTDEKTPKNETRRSSFMNFQSASETLTAVNDQVLDHRKSVISGGIPAPMAPVAPGFEMMNTGGLHIGLFDLSPPKIFDVPIIAQGK